MKGPNISGDDAGADSSDRLADIIERSPYGWVADFFSQVPPRALPILPGETICIASDASGQSKSSRFVTTSILFVDLDQSREWEVRRRNVRDAFLGQRRMSFKDMNDGQRRRALPYFLDAADHICGLCVCIAIDKSIRTLCSDDRLLDRLRSAAVLRAEWNQRGFEEMARIVHFVAILMAAVCVPGQNVYWISDNDNFLANSTYKTDTARLLSSFTSNYLRHPMGELGVGTTDISEDDLYEEDCASIPDLVAGASAEILTSLKKEHQRIPRIPCAIPRTISRKAAVVSDWFFGSAGSLKRMSWLFTHDQGKGPSVGVWNLRVAPGP